MMKRSTIIGFILILTALTFIGCNPKKVTHTDDVIPEAQPVGTISNSTDQQGGQLPEDVVKKASKAHGGSMIPVETATSNGGETNSTALTLSGKTMILGPINAQRVINNEEVSSDAGQSIRETISQKLTSDSDITLFDAPEERFIDDSPRPDLSRKGVTYVIKGVASTSSDGGETTVFLRAVDTMTGKVSVVASARDKSRNRAASEATERLLQKITGMK